MQRRPRHAQPSTPTRSCVARSWTAEHVAVIGRVAADQLGITSIDRQPVVFLDDTPYVIAGIIDDVARNPDLLLAITIPTTTADTQFAATDAERQVLIDTAPGAAQLIGMNRLETSRPYRTALP